MQTVEQKVEKIAGESTDLSQNSNSLCKPAGIRTRGKRRVDYKFMINNDIYQMSELFLEQAKAEAGVPITLPSPSIRHLGTIL